MPHYLYLFLNNNKNGTLFYKTDQILSKTKTQMQLYFANYSPIHLYVYVFLKINNQTNKQIKYYSESVLFQE